MLRTNQVSVETPAVSALSAALCAFGVCVSLSSVGLAAADDEGATDPAEGEPPPTDEPKKEGARSEASSGADVAEPEEERATTGCHCSPEGMLWFVDGGARLDLGNFRRVDRVGRNEDIDDDDINAWGGMVRLGFLSRVSDRWRVGGAVGYGFNYDLDNNGDLLGQLLTADARLELSAPIDEKWALLAMPRAGLSVIVPGGILQDRIQANQNLGLNTWSGPRFGFLAGVEAGARYFVNDWFSVRATAGYTFTMHFLINSGASSDTVSASQNWWVQASRVTGNLGLEAQF